MSFWIELHCDIEAPGRDPGNPTIAGCWTVRGDNIGLLSHHSAIQHQPKFLREMAKQQGWERIGHKWACPYCKTQKP